MVFVVFVIASFTSRFRVGVDSFFHINHLIPCKPTCQALFSILAKIFSSVLARKLYLFGAISGTQIVRVGAERFERRGVVGGCSSGGRSMCGVRKRHPTSRVPFPVGEFGVSYIQDACGLSQSLHRQGFPP